MPTGWRVANFVASHVCSHRQTSTGYFTVLRAAGVHGSSGSSSSGDTPLGAEGPYASKLKTRGVIRFDGPEVFHFLQGLVTNDVLQLEGEPQGQTATLSPNAPSAYQPPIYSAMLNSQGRFLYDLFFYKPLRQGHKLNRTGTGPKKEDENEPVLLADVDADNVDEIMAYLKKHILRAKVQVHNISEDLAVWQYYGGRLVERPDEKTEAESGSIGWGATTDGSAQSSAETSVDKGRWFKDPRLSTLGLRGLFPKNSLPPLIEADEEVEENYYLLWRLEQGIAEGSVEIPKGEAIPLEYNLAGLNAISFEKGCYVGQELVARTHHRGVIRKRLVPLNFVNGNGEEAQQAVTPGADVVNKATGKKVGKVTTVLGPRGLGLLRLDSAFNAQLQIENQEDTFVKGVRPKWWPSKWGCEDELHAAGNS